MGRKTKKRGEKPLKGILGKPTLEERKFPKREKIPGNQFVPIKKGNQVWLNPNFHLKRTGMLGRFFREPGEL